MSSTHEHIEAINKLSRLISKENILNKCILFFISAIIFSPAQASLISADDIYFGTDAITYDTDSNLKWLDLTYSKGYSYNELSAETVSGGLFYGFHIATIDEVQTLFDSALLPSIGTGTTDFAAVNALIDLIGFTSIQDSYLQAFGITSSPGSFDGGYRVAGLDYVEVGALSYYSTLGGLTYSASLGPDSVGVWLVGESIRIPEPTTFSIFISGLIMIILFMNHSLNKRKNARKLFIA